MMLFFNFFMAWARNRYARLRGYDTIANSDEQLARNVSCASCPEYEYGSCRICKCITLAKTMLTTEQCPKKRWLRIWRKKVTVNR